MSLLKYGAQSTLECHVIELLIKENPIVIDDTSPFLSVRFSPKVFVLQVKVIDHMAFRLPQLVIFIALLGAKLSTSSESFPNVSSDKP